MKRPNTILIPLAVLFLSACTPKQPTALPEDWYRLKPTSTESFELERPSPAADQAVQDLFQAHTRALERMTEDGSTASAALNPMETLLAGKPADWVPWHLQAMIASFGVSMDGVLGALLFSGSASIKGTWERPDTLSSRSPALSRRNTDLRISNATTEKDLSRQLEPSIRAAVASGLLPNENAEARLRKTLLKQARDFRTLCRALSNTHFANGWEVEAFRLEVGFDSSGSISPVSSAGVSVNFRFDWERGEGFAQPGTQEEGELQKNLRGFVAAVSRDIQEVSAESTALRDSPFELEEVRIGLGIAASGEIGIATDELSVVGSITFAKPEEPVLKQSGARAALESEPLPETIALLSKPRSTAGIHPAGFFDGIANRLKRSQFRRGLGRAIAMGSYFANTGARSEDSSSTWKISEIEAEFELTVEGTLGVTTVDGIGIVVLGFTRKD